MKLSVVLMTAALALGSAAAMAAGSWSNVTVTGITVYPPYEGAGTQGWVLVTLSGNSSGGPSCAVNNKNQVAIDLASAGGGAMFQQFETLRLSGGTISLSGIGDCALISNAERIGYTNQ